MSLLPAVLDLFLGLAGLLIGGELLVRGAVRLAYRLRLSPMVIGLTVVAFGTSSPELVVCVLAALEGRPGLALGNVIGSNIANILLIFGTMVVLCPVVAKRHETLRDGSVLIAVSVAMVLIAFTGEFSRVIGALLLASLAAYLYVTYMTSPAMPEAEELVHETERSLVLSNSLFGALAFSAVGVLGLVFGSELFVDGAVEIAKAAGVTDLVIGVTLVAVGTSLPELATVVIAAVRRHAEVALGNIVGSNIFNILGILGTTAVVKPVPVPPGTAFTELYVMIGVSVLLVALMYGFGRLGRAAGTGFLAFYIMFVASQFGIGPITVGGLMH